MNYLGVPIVLGTAMIAVHDKDYLTASQKLQDYEFRITVTDRRPAPELLARLPNPDKVMKKVNKKYERLDKSTTLFDYPINHHLAGGLKLNLVPNSFANLPTPGVADDSMPDTVATKDYDIYGNIFDPLEGTLIESFAKGVISDEGRIHEEAFGPWDRRVSKRLGSKKEMPVDMRGNMLPE
ncbi:hypothetical protein N7517_003921 [Penicillium concentricum]|uniref:Uncharacterized protein n=1 Tax=Penicillium concentricum TaxID=293559 RepID=A0A9W9S4U7_9EURO|nr:uncharacterized protein N7517_003921 [Penicillium concentricum]KAJ5371915.1 hypothetical protein N7517_003921 [Penicillium concentricum]